MEEINPLIWKALYPRNLTVPKGYADPRWYSTLLAGAILAVFRPHQREVAHKTAYTIASVLAANKVPYYFIADEFAQAVANTDLPGDFKFAELKWPLDAQVFVLSNAFCEAYYGFTGAPYLAVCRINPGTVPECIGRKMPNIGPPWPTLVYKREFILSDHSYFGSETAVNYNTAYPMTDGIEVFKDCPMHDATLLDVKNYGRDLTPIGALSGDQEKEYRLKAEMLTTKLLMTVANMQSMVEPGKLTRNAVTTLQGRVKLPALFSPNIIGRTYRIPGKRTQAVAAGSRAKPRFLFRRGHWTWQAKMFKNQEFISVNAMPRTPEGTIDFTVAGEQLGQKFYACHERQWIEGRFWDEAEVDIGKLPISNPGANPPQ